MHERNRWVRNWTKAYWEIVRPELASLALVLVIIFFVTWILAYISPMPNEIALLSVTSIAADLLSLSTYVGVRYSQAKERKILIARFQEDGAATRDAVAEEGAATRSRIDEVSLLHYRSIFLDIADVMERNTITEAEWFRKIGLKWVDIDKKCVYSRIDIINLLKRKIEEKPVTLLNAKSGAGKTSIAFLLGHHLLESDKWNAVYYVDLKQNPMVTKTDLASFAIHINSNSDPADDSSATDLIIIDNAHLSPGVVRSIVTTCNTWRERVRILVITRTSEDSSKTLQMQLLPDDGSYETLERSNTDWSGILCGFTSPESNLGIVNLGPIDFRNAVSSILLEYTRQKGLTASEGLEVIANILCHKCGNSLRILSFVLRMLEEDPNLVVNSEIQVQQLRGVNICDRVNEYYDNLGDEISSITGDRSISLDLENAFDKTLGVLSLLNTMEIPCSQTFIPALVNTAYPDTDISIDAVSIILNHARKTVDLVKHSLSVMGELHTLYNFPHNSEASYVYQCRTKLKPSNREEHRRVEAVLKRLLKLCDDESLPIPLLQVMLFSKNIGLELYDLPRFLEEDAPHLVRLALLQEGDITSAVLHNLGILGYSVGVEIAKAIRDMNSPWEGVGTLWQMYRYDPGQNETNPVWDAIVDIEEKVIESIQTSGTPWRIIAEIDHIELLMGSEYVQDAIKSVSNKIAKAMSDDEQVLVYVMNVLDLLDNEEIVRTVADTVPRLEAKRGLSEYFICKIFRYDPYRKSREIRNSVLKILPKIVDRMISSKSPSYTIGQLGCIEDLLPESARKAIIKCVDALAEELLDPSSHIVLGAISWVNDLVTHGKIRASIVRRLEISPNDLLLVSRISKIPDLAKNSEIKSAIAKAMTKSTYSHMFIEEVWRNNLWASEEQFTDAARTKTSEIAKTMMYHANPRIFFLNLPRFIFETKDLEEVINNPDTLSRIMKPVSPDLGVRIPFTKGVAEILKSILNDANKETYAKQLE